MKLSRATLLATFLSASTFATAARADFAVALETAAADAGVYRANQAHLRARTTGGERGYFLELSGQKRDYDGGGGFSEGGLTVGGYAPFDGGYLGWDVGGAPAAVTYAQARVGVEPRWFAAGGEVGCGLAVARYKELSTLTLHPVGTWILAGAWRIDAGLFLVHTDETVPSAHGRVSRELSPSFTLEASAAGGRTVEDAATVVDFRQAGAGAAVRFGAGKAGLSGGTYQSDTRSENILALRFEVPL